ncbi:MAG: ribosome small subunit-dependent GTPase A [Flavobacteriaceae bacterium]|nr:ribosome small subunit-dependent GTPase A [Flavobacteriaceae bacterium]
MQGIVTKSTGSWYVVRTEVGQYTPCRIRGKFRMEGIKSTNPVAVGDVVDFELEPQKETGVINKIHPRKNYIIRKSVNLSKQTHIIAANIDQAFLLITIANPVTMTSFIERFIATAEAYSIPVILLFNKVDSYTEIQLQELEQLKDIYEDIGYECIDISAVTGRNVGLVKELMKDQVSLFSGHSGVGKSTLINLIEPTLNLKTTIVSVQSGQGQHTTTFAEMFELSFGGFIIDTPGIKGFGVVDFEKQEVSDYFPEIFHFKQYCKFNNCLHLEEPGCAVLEAVEQDEIAFSRYRSYVQLLENDDNYRGINEF